VAIVGCSRITLPLRTYMMGSCDDPSLRKATGSTSELIGTPPGRS
jgi:hypothetical protein